MNWKNFSIGKKIGLGFGLILLLLAFVAGYTLVKLGEIEAGAERQMQGSELNEEIMQRHIDHLNWNGKVLQMMLHNGKGADEIHLDPTQCGFGKFFYGDRRVGAEKTLPALREVFARIEEPHRQVHTSAKKIIDAVRENDIAGALQVYDRETAPALKAVNGDFDEADEIIGKELSDSQAFHASIAQAYRVALILSLVILFIGVVSSVFLSGVIRKPIAAMVGTLKYVAEGDLTRRAAVDGKDEIGLMAEALNETIGRMQQSLRSIEENAVMLAGSSEEISSVSNQMSSNAAETSAQADVVSAAAEQVTKNIDTVATASEEMASTIKEIAQNAGEAARVALEAIGTAETTNAAVSRLGQSSTEIGNVVNLITSIAEQTNLLALNATIEAARAGEMGKGFAVVANEVKELAKETAKATEDIARKIEKIQEDTKSAVSATQEFNRVLEKINEISQTIATAVEEQSVTTSEITRNVAEAAQGSVEIARNIAGVADAAKSTSSGATDTQQAVGELAKMAADLKQLVHQFKC